MVKRGLESRARLSLGLLLAFGLLLGFVCVRIEAQFFTKSSSKSIPRMGRRSDSSMNPSMRYYMMSRHGMPTIDRLLDEYGPNLVNLLQAIGEPPFSRRFGGQESYEVAENPVSVNEIQAEGSEDGVQGISFDKQTQQGPSYRVERSPVSAKQGESLAMRALYLDKLLRHLSSGQPPVAYERLMDSKVDNGGYNGNYKEEKRQSAESD